MRAGVADAVAGGDTGGGAVGADDAATGAGTAGADAVTVTTTTAGCVRDRGSASTRAGFEPVPTTSNTTNQTEASTTVTALPCRCQRATNARAAPRGGTTSVTTTTAGTAKAGCQRGPGPGKGEPVSGGGYTRLQTRSTKWEDLRHKT